MGVCDRKRHTERSGEAEPNYNDSQVDVPNFVVHVSVHMLSESTLRLYNIRAKP